MDKCGKCGKTVYPTEKVMSIKKPWHKACFRCAGCNSALTLGKESEGKDGMPYCQKCHQIKSGVSGYGFGVASLDSHSYHTNVQSGSSAILPSAPAPVASTGGAKFCSNCGTKSTGANFCSSCGNKL